MDNVRVVRLVVSLALLLLALFLVITHFVLLSTSVKRHIKNQDRRTGSGVPLVPVLLAGLSWLIGPGITYLNYIVLAVILVDPMNWVLLYHSCKWVLTGRFGR